MTNYPKQGEDKAVSLRNSNFSQFDHDFASQLKEDEPKVWGAGGNIRGNEAFNLWTRARQGDDAESVLSWIREREAWAARHIGDGSQFPEDSPNLSNIGGVVAAIKWGVILDIGEATMKDAVREVIEKQNRNHDHIMERRFFTTSIEARSDSPETQDAPKIEGYASVFTSEADLGNFTETIDPNAFGDVIGDDVRMLFNHDPNFPLARSRDGEGTLDMRVDEKGLFFSFPVGPQTYAKDLHQSILRGDVDQASFAFTVDADEWEERDGKPHRHITRLGSLIDLSVVTYPAYEATRVAARSLPTPPVQETQIENKVEEGDKTFDRVKWSRQRLALAKLKTTNS